MSHEISVRGSIPVIPYKTTWESKGKKGTYSIKIYPNKISAKVGYEQRKKIKITDITSNVPLNQLFSLIVVSKQALKILIEPYLTTDSDVPKDYKVTLEYIPKSPVAARGMSASVSSLPVVLQNSVDFTDIIFEQYNNYQITLDCVRNMQTLGLAHEKNQNDVTIDLMKKVTENFEQPRSLSMDFLLESLPLIRLSPASTKKLFCDRLKKEIESSTLITDTILQITGESLQWCLDESYFTGAKQFLEELLPIFTKIFKRLPYLTEKFKDNPTLFLELVLFSLEAFRILNVNMIKDYQNIQRLIIKDYTPNTLLKKSLLHMIREFSQEPSFSCLLSARKLLDVKSKEILSKVAPDLLPVFLQAIILIITKNILNYSKLQHERGLALHYLKILVRIYEENTGIKKGSFLLLTKQEKEPISLDEDKIQIKDQIVSFLNSCIVHHPIKAIQAFCKKILTTWGIYNNEMNSPTSSAPRFVWFERQIKNSAPWLYGLQMMKDAQDNDPQLLAHKDIFIPLNVSSPKLSSGQRFDAALHSFIQNRSQHLLFLIGAMGCGKSITMKMLVSKFCLEPHWDDYIPIFISLPSFDNFENIIETYLERFGLLAHINHFKKTKIVWVLDALDEVANRARYNISFLKLLLKNWPNSKFLVTSRPENAKEGSIEEALYYNLKGLEEAQRKEYVAKYEKRKKDPNDPSMQRGFNLVSLIEQLKPMPFVTEIFLFFNLFVQMLPYLYIKFQTVDLIAQQIQQRGALFNIYCCFLIERERLKQRQSVEGPFSHKADEYLEFAVNLAIEFEKVSKLKGRNYLIKEDELGNPYIDKLFNPEKKHLIFRRTIPIVFDQDRWTYTHIAFKEHYLFLNDNPIEYASLKSKLASGDFEWKDFIESKST